MRSKRTSIFLATAVLLTASCQGRQGSDAAIDCVDIDDCPADQVCFFGKCVDPGYNIQEVWADVTPPDDSGLLPQIDLDSPRDLSQTLQQDIALVASVTLRGDIRTAAGEVRTGELVASPYLEPEDVLVPSAARPFRTTVSESGFELRLLPGLYTLTFEPHASTPPRPPISLTPDGPLSTSDASTRQAFIYPADTELVRVCGFVLPVADSTTATEGALVSGTARGFGGKEIHSSTAISDDLTGYELAFPPGAQTFTITVRPGTAQDANIDVPTATRALQVVPPPSPTGCLQLEPFVLNVAAARSTLSANVRGPGGEGVSDASLVFQGLVGAGTVTETASSGGPTGYFSTDLLAGNYQLTVVPLRSQPYALTTTSFCIGEVADPSGCDTLLTEGTSAQFTVRSKIRVDGMVTDFEGRAVGNALLTFRLENVAAPIAREFTTTTSAAGAYSLDVDPGDAGGAATYEVTVQPIQSGLSPRPRHRELIEVNDDPIQEIDLHLYDVSLVYGTIRGPGGSPLGGAEVAFYSAEVLGSTDEPLLVGVGQSNQDGEFVIPLPILDSP